MLTEAVRRLKGRKGCSRGYPEAEDVRSTRVGRCHLAIVQNNCHTPLQWFSGVVVNRFGLVRLCLGNASPSQWGYMYHRLRLGLGVWTKYEAREK